jgi:leucine dehydrogenase
VTGEPLFEMRHTRLHKRGIPFLPDYVINAGGIIAVAREYLGGAKRDDVRREVESIPDRLAGLLQLAKTLGIPPNDAADRKAREIIETARLARSPRRPRSQGGSPGR